VIDKSLKKITSIYNKTVNEAGACNSGKREENEGVKLKHIWVSMTW